MKLLDVFSRKPKPRKCESFSCTGTVLFSFIRAFSNLAVKISPEQMIAFLHEHLNAQTSIIEKHSGVVLTSVGDAIMAFWRDSDSEQKSADLAFRAAQAMLADVDTSVKYRIVLGTGTMAGDFFGPIKQYQIVGEAMNIAEELARFHSLNSAPPKVILLTENTLARIKPFSVAASSDGTLSNNIKVYSYTSG